MNAIEIAIIIGMFLSWGAIVFGLLHLTISDILEKREERRKREIEEKEEFRRHREYNDNRIYNNNDNTDIDTTTIMKEDEDK